MWGRLVWVWASTDVATLASLNCGSKLQRFIGGHIERIVNGRNGTTFPHDSKRCLLTPEKSVGSWLEFRPFRVRILPLNDAPVRWFDRKFLISVHIHDKRVGAVREESYVGRAPRTENSTYCSEEGNVHGLCTILRFNFVCQVVHYLAIELKKSSLYVLNLSSATSKEVALQPSLRSSNFIGKA